MIKELIIQLAAFIQTVIYLVLTIVSIYKIIIAVGIHDIYSIAGYGCILLFIALNSKQHV